MNSSRKIEISQSSLLGLKAELLRKKEEIEKSKLSETKYVKPLLKTKLKTKFEKENEGVSRREFRDAEEIQAESDELKKSQSALIAKAKLYDQLMQGHSTTDTTNFLVNFDEKNNEIIQNEIEDEVEVEERRDEVNVSDDDDDDFDDSDWVEFVDCLGRTRRCLKEDLEGMKRQDEKLSSVVRGREEEPQPKAVEEKVLVTKDIGRQPDLCSEDMRREIMRQKWEEQEQALLDKNNIHYQDVLFNEARSHGVGYYGFSSEEETRLKQQAELKKLRKETEEQQANVQSTTDRKKLQMEERLKAARRRKRERLGLPEEEEEVQEVPEPPEPKPEVEELRRDVRKTTAPVRPWDSGKTEHDVMSQEQWVSKKREERPQEFAPPTSYRDSKSKNKRSYPSSSRKRPREDKDSDSPSSSRRYPPPGGSTRYVETEERVEERGRGGGVEIPPPFVLQNIPPPPKPQIPRSVVESIEQGLRNLRRQAEERQAQKEKGLLDIV